MFLVWSLRTAAPAMGPLFVVLHFTSIRRGNAATAATIRIQLVETGGKDPMQHPMNAAMFYRGMNVVFADSELGYAEKAVLGALLWHVADESMIVDGPPVVDLAERAGMSASTFKRAASRLIELGVLSTRPGHERTGKNHVPTKYTLILDESATMGHIDPHYATQFLVPQEENTPNSPVGHIDPLSHNHERSDMDPDVRAKFDQIIRSQISPLVETSSAPEDSAPSNPASHPYWARAREIQGHFAAELVRRGWSKPRWERENAKQASWTSAIVKLLSAHVDWADVDLVEDAIDEVLDANEGRARGYAGPDGPSLLGSDLGAAISRMASAGTVLASHGLDPADGPVLRSVDPSRRPGTHGDLDRLARLRDGIAAAREGRSDLPEQCWEDRTPERSRPTLREVIAA
jgi:hypothetical protein